MPNERASGILLHISSLPGPYGIGTLGKYARQFADFLHKSKQKYWQILPLSPTGFGDSPYQSCSAMAGNPYFIDLETLIEEGLLEPSELESRDFGNDIDYVDYGKIYENRFEVLRLAFERGRTRFEPEIRLFCEENAYWLPDYALFMAIKEHFGMKALRDWPDAGIRRRREASLKKYAALLADDVDFHVFLQFMFFRQWTALRSYAAEKGVRIIGDAPIYVSEDSVELWTSPELFMLNAKKEPKLVAGVPPDFYSPTGQLWGNPLYDWRYHESTGFEWWIARLRHLQRFYDTVRIDHFRGIESFWAVKAGESDAVNGKWLKGPQMAFVKAIRTALPELDIIAEDLGDLNDKVRAFFKATELPGMRLLVDAFDPDNESDFLPHNFPKNCVAYSSTADSPPFMDFYAEKATDEQREYAKRYLRMREDEGMAWCALRTLWASCANLVIAPFADTLGLGSDARMNIPATLGGRNWCWRVRQDALNDGIATTLAEMTELYWR